MLRRALLGFSLIAGLAGSPARAIEPTLLPDFTAFSREGEARHAADLAGSRAESERWLLLWLPARWEGFSACLEALSHPAYADRVAVVVEGIMPAELNQELKGREKLGNLRWLADPTRTVRAALPAGGAPAAFGLRGEVIEWVYAGTGPNVSEYQAALTGWLGARSP